MAGNVGKESRNQQLEKLAYEYQLLQAQAGILAQNLELLTLARNELLAVKETLEGLEKEENEEVEILVPIGAGSFLKGKLTDKSNAIVSMGAGYSAERSIEEAVKLIEKRLQEYDTAISKTQEGLRQIEAKLQSLAQKAHELQR